MPDYSQGKIYCLRSYETDDIYIGSTTLSLAIRKGQHKIDYKSYLNNKKYFVTSFNIIKYDDCYIELIEEYPCENKQQLAKKEGEYIRNRDCVNKNIAGRTKKEYREANKDKIVEYRKDNKDKIAEYKVEYYKANKEKIIEKQAEYRKANKEKRAEYRKANKDKIAEWGVEYRKDNKDKIAEKNAEKITCECGSVISRSSFSTHKKTKKHQKLIENLP